MRILWITQNFFPSRGGMARSCERLVRTLRELDVVVDLLHFDPRVPEITVERRVGGRHIRCPLDEDVPHALNLAWTFLERDGETAATTHLVAFGGLLPILCAPVYAAWLDRPLITLLRGNDFDVAVFQPRRIEALRRALERSARVVVVSRDKERRIRALFPGVDPVWIPNGIRLDEWVPLESDRERAREFRARDVEAGRRVLGLFGHIKRKKGGLFFLEALDRPGTRQAVHLLLAGEVETGINERFTAVEAGSEAPLTHTRVPFLDPFDLIEWYLACDAVVLPSYYDGLPNVLLEAGALGLPVIASTAGGMRDLLEDEVHGWLFEPGDAAGCRLAIHRFLSSEPGRVAEFGARLRHRIASDLDHRTEARRFLAVLEDTSRTPRGSRLPDTGPERETASPEGSPEVHSA